jgi:hypothetical protein
MEKPVENGNVLEASSRLRDDAQKLAASVGDFTEQAKDALNEVIETRPYVALAGAFAVGYLLAGGLSSRLTRIGLAMAGRYLIANLGGEMLENVRR